MSLDKTVKYDRQLRLWAANGQAALENARIALVGGKAAGAETLKNLVLPGIGSFTVLDHRAVTPQDAGCNFFVTMDDVGRPRAQVVAGLLQELNADVQGTHRSVNVTAELTKTPDYFVNDFDLVIVAQLDPTSLRILASSLWQANIPLVVVNSIGFMGILRIAVPEHCIVETHPDAIVDLRLDVPWPELSAFASSMDLQAMDNNEHTHVPYIALLLRYLEEWKDTHNGLVPSNFDEKDAFKKLIRSGMRNVDEDNFDEAVANVWRACGKTHIPSDIHKLFDDDACVHLTATSNDFWLMTRAVSDFTKAEGNGLLPLAGIVPDMKSDTTRFIQLQMLYRAKASQDVAAVRTHLERHCKELGRNVPSQADLETFCKHAAYLKVIRYRSIEQEFDRPKRNLWDEESLLAWYVAHAAAQSFESTYGRVPGSDMADHDDHEALYELACKHPLVSDQSSDWLRKVCHEYARCGGGTLHNIASFMGGLASQEVIKLLTRQYIPVNNTCIFDGISSTSQVFEL
ncbi:NEDD8-activating enzyme E1 regulatory subunit-like protein [Protomyces lactucae-debilis]|uniref:NEDD8-activating enzyme E1 regulatory subunit n=1 Tax=Protomyces lactucae-debilis TaxID=2754530 RepID=A0A1Y2F482_PROLT|nr:NEDD8-activating enzyme E1 regulatory subunit-like protein [Protomyces lactucae-debilis]ORY78126.1 NEDD8-activating enzyme E1 regulatory subunit-like protein [Protomyces lactucae-debilis]